MNLQGVDLIIYSIFERFNPEWEKPHPQPNLLKQLDVTQVYPGLFRFDDGSQPLL